VSAKGFSPTSSKMYLSSGIYTSESRRDLIMN
jgi:hypothetical protein